MAVIIREILNNSTSSALVRNYAKESDTYNVGIRIQAGMSRKWLDVNFEVPTCQEGDSGDFGNRHIKIDLGDGRIFAVWQASYDFADRVRVSTDGLWHSRGDVIGVLAATGPLEDLPPFEPIGPFLPGLGMGERTLIVNDLSLWLVPYSVTQTLAAMAARQRADGYKLCGDPVDRPIASVPRKSSIAFSMPGIASDAFDRGQRGARFLYRDSGKRYEFAIRDGVVYFDPPLLNGVRTVGRALSHVRGRVGTPSPAPPFDMVASNGGRLFAKEKGWDRFYFALVDHGYIHVGPDGKELDVPSTYFKLDPEFNQGGQPQDLMPPVSEGFADTRAFGGHPAAERWPVLRLILRYGLIEAMVVRVQRNTWHLIDTRRPALDPIVQAAWSLDKNLPVYDKIASFVQGYAVRTLKVQNAGPPLWAPAYDHVHYCPAAPAKEMWQQAVDFKLVLDIGVGHVHHHEQYECITGGEIQALRARKVDTDFFDDPAEPYRFMNGPVKDGDGYIDGTCNFYVLAQLKDKETISAAEGTRSARRDAYGLLYLDEQSFFSQRWHLAHPDDWRGVAGSIVDAVHSDSEGPPRPRRYGFARSYYWCPFRTGHIGPRSRLAVAAQVVVVTGEDANSTEPEPLLYSTNFSFVSMDRTWRWRKLPAAARYFDRASSLWKTPVAALTGDEQVPNGSDVCVYPQTVRIRDDMTICLQGRGPGPSGAAEVGRYYQRYLPATNELVPPASELTREVSASCMAIRSDLVRFRSEITDLERAKKDLLESSLHKGERNEMIAEINTQIDGITALIAAAELRWSLEDCEGGSRPTKGYTHPWKFLPEAVFQLADRFSHFGAYITVDSRTQFYVVGFQQASAADAQAKLAAGEGGAWLDDSKQLHVKGYAFRADWMRLPWPTGLDLLRGLILKVSGWLLHYFFGIPAPSETVLPVTLDERKSPASLFNPDTRLRIVRRGSHWIAMHWDKRDDDLIPFLDRNLILNFTKWINLQYRDGAELQNVGTMNVRLALKDSCWVEQPPAGSLAYFGWQPPSPSGEVRAVVGFVPSRPQGGLSNVWRVRMAALVPGRPGEVVSLRDVVTTPDTFMPITGGAFEYSWLPSAAERIQLKEYCSLTGALKYGTSIWFEDVVGHVSAPEEVRWHGEVKKADTLDKAIRSFNYRDRYVRHERLPAQPHLGEVEWTSPAFTGGLTTVVSDLDRLDSTFLMVPGLAGRGVSFESVMYRGRYLRHKEFRVQLHAFEDNNLFRGDATFHRRSGLADSAWESLESDNLPGHFVRHKAFQLWVEKPTPDIGQFHADATFSILPGMYAQSRATVPRPQPSSPPATGSVGSTSMTTGIGAKQL